MFWLASQCQSLRYFDTLQIFNRCFTFPDLTKLLPLPTEETINTNKQHMKASCNLTDSESIWVSWSDQSPDAIRGWLIGTKLRVLLTIGATNGKTHSESLWQPFTGTLDGCLDLRLHLLFAMLFVVKLIVQISGTVVAQSKFSMSWSSRSCQS